MVDRTGLMDRPQGRFITLQFAPGAVDLLDVM